MNTDEILYDNANVEKARLVATIERTCHARFPLLVTWIGRLSILNAKYAPSLVGLRHLVLAERTQPTTYPRRVQQPSNPVESKPLAS